MKSLVEKFPNIWLPLPEAFVSAFDKILATERHWTWHAYFLDKHIPTGVWYFFPIVWFLKTPSILVLILLILLGVSAWRVIRGFRMRWEWNFTTFLVLSLVWFAFYFCFIFRVHVGIRYVLFCLPLFYILLGPPLAKLMRFKFSTEAAILVFCLILLEESFYFGNTFAFTNLTIFPKKNVYLWISDSSLDWGQNRYKIPEKLKSWNVQAEINPAHVLPGNNIFEINTLVGVWWNREQHEWVRKNLRPHTHILYTHLWYKVSEASFQKFISEERTVRSKPENEKFCVDKYKKKKAKSKDLLFNLKPKDELKLCLRVEKERDVILRPLNTNAKADFQACSSREVQSQKMSWYRLQPGFHVLCLSSFAASKIKLEGRGEEIHYSPEFMVSKSEHFK